MIWWNGEESTSTTHRVLYVAERAAGTRAELGHDRDASHQDEGEHDGVFDGRRALLTGKESSDGLKAAFHADGPLDELGFGLPFSTLTQG